LCFYPRNTKNYLQLLSMLFSNMQH
jgi:hypothetical protein